MSDIDYHTMSDGRRIAFRHIKPAANSATIVFLPGYMSDMTGGKAGAVWEFAREQGIGCLLLDYSGCGTSEGGFSDGTLSRWRDEVLALIEARSIAEVVLTGSSMGGWLMLLVAQELGTKLAGMVGIAAAPDFSDWGYSDAQKSLLMSGGTVMEDNPYGPEPTPTHSLFWHDAETHKVLHGPIGITCPVRLLHGQMDADVPWETSMRLLERLRSDDVQLTLVKDGDHRLSRDGDIKLLLGQISNLAG